MTRAYLIILWGIPIGTAIEHNWSWLCWPCWNPSTLTLHRVALPTGFRRSCWKLAS